MIIYRGLPDGNLKISDEAICPTSIPKPLAASTAVRAVSARTVTWPVTPRSLAA